MAEAQKDITYLKQLNTCKSITTIIRTNVRAAKSLHHDYIHQVPSAQPYPRKIPHE